MAGFSFCVGIIGDFELPVGEDVRATGCLSSLPHVERALLNQSFILLKRYLDIFDRLSSQKVCVQQYLIQLFMD